MIRKLDKAELQQATTLALEVYLQCGQDDFEDEGLESFKSFIFNDKLMNELCIYRSEEHTSELQSQHLIPYAVFCLKKTREIGRAHV